MLTKNGKATFKNTLHWCNSCHEHSVIRRNYMRKTDNRMERFEFCLNKGCGYKIMLPFRILTEQERRDNE